MSTPSVQASELRQRLVQQIRDMFPGVLAITPEQFASLAKKNRIWGYRRIWSGQVNALGTEGGVKSQQYQILIEEVADYFANNSKSISKVEVTAQGEIKSIAKKSRGSARTNKELSKPEGSAITYVVTLLDLADQSVQMQFVRAKNGQDAGNYALCFDEQGEEREEGYQVVSVISVYDLSAFEEEAKTVPSLVVPSTIPTGDRSWAEGSLISD
jgi:hypothetical protein